MAQARHKRRALLKSVALFERRLPRFERKASEIEALHATFASAGVPDPVEAVQRMTDATAAMKEAERQVVGTSVTAVAPSKWLAVLGPCVTVACCAWIGAHPRVHATTCQQLSDGNPSSFRVGQRRERRPQRYQYVHV